MIPDRLAIQFDTGPDGLLRARRLYPDGPLGEFFGEWLSPVQLNAVAAAILMHTNVGDVPWNTTPDIHDAFICRPERLRRPRAGYVYLVREHGGSHKIGWTTHPNRRIWEEISPKLPHPLVLVAAIATDDAIALESALHARFASKRLQGEWFSLGEEDVELFLRSSREGEAVFLRSSSEDERA